MSNIDSAIAYEHDRQTEPTPASQLPDGEYAIVELLGHSTLVGRIYEIERFGTKMLAMEPLFRNTLLPAVYHGGGSIYRLTPCSKEVAWARHPQSSYQLPPAIQAIVPPDLLPPPVGFSPGVPEEEDDYDPDNLPF